MASAQEAPRARTLWPIDKLFIANFIILICLLYAAARNDTRALLYIAVHVAAIGVLLVLARASSGPWPFLHHWFVLIYLPLCY
ncbi:MAG TPA: hypothetical protein VFB76_15765, partial [Candidatus Angelobacter sp.]|nr:hypothetical protein [Candidatus Angelobacter sp.]